MKTFPRLYKRSKTGSIQYWSIRVDTQEQYPTIVKNSGVLDTDSPLEHREQIKTGKNLGRTNETLPLEQAILQAESDWKKKRDEGYKSLEDLGLVQTSMAELKALLQEKLPTFNTDASGNVKPMLAKAMDWSKALS